MFSRSIIFSKPLPSMFAVSIAALALFNGMATSLSWYWRIDWLDILMHFLGGAWIGALGIWWYAYGRKNFFGQMPALISPAAVSLAAALAAGIAWEFFEYAVHALFPTGRPYDAVDTGSDIAFDLAGAIFAVLILARHFAKSGGDNVFTKSP